MFYDILKPYKGGAAMIRLTPVQAADRTLLWNIQQKYLHEMTTRAIIITGILRNISPIRCGRRC